MHDAFIQLALFSAKTVILFFFVVLLLLSCIAIIGKGKGKTKGWLSVKNLNHHYNYLKETILEKSLPKKKFKQYSKEQKAQEKAKEKSDDLVKNIYVINFNGDIKASAVSALREEINAIINVATETDEVVLRIESPGGMVHAYGLAAAQLQRLRDKHIPLTVTIDKIAASGGYLMACIANKIIAAPFAIVGSIGVIVQLPNFHRLLKSKQIDFEQETAGEYKRTLTLFGQNTDEGREKLKEEIEEIHQLFKNLIHSHRKQVDISKVATGEHWLGQQALELQLVDTIQTSDAYLLEKSKTANIYEISYQTKQSFLNKFASQTAHLWEKLATKHLFL